MSADHIVHNRIALMLGDAIIGQTRFAAEAEMLRAQNAELQKQTAALEKLVAEMTPVSEQQPPQDAP